MFLLKKKEKEKIGRNKLEDARTRCDYTLRKYAEEGNREDANSMQMKKARQRENS